MNETVRAGIIVDYSSYAKRIDVSVRPISRSILVGVLFVILTRKEVTESIVGDRVSIIILASIVLGRAAADLIRIWVVVLVALLRINVWTAEKRFLINAHFDLDLKYFHRSWSLIILICYNLFCLYLIYNQLKICSDHSHINFNENWAFVIDHIFI